MSKFKVLVTLAFAAPLLFGGVAVAYPRHNNHHNHCEQQNEDYQNHKKKKCEVPVDVCPNIEGNQATVPEGLVKDEQGQCVEKIEEPPVPVTPPVVAPTPAVTVPEIVIVEGFKGK